MKLMSSLVGIAIACIVYKWFPELFSKVLSIAWLNAGFIAIAGLLNISWPLALSRLSVFEKLDDLSSQQKSITIDKAGYFRKHIIRSMVVNTLLVVISVLIIALATMPDLKVIAAPWVGYWIFFSLFFLAGSLCQGFLCLEAIEKSRLALAETQSLQRQRQAYLAKMRSDEIAKPIDHNDSHLQKYTQDYNAC